MTAYLVIREGSKWTDVFRLVEGESVTIGRSPTNAIVVKDERCSRNHAEIFQVQHSGRFATWIVATAPKSTGPRSAPTITWSQATSFVLATRI